MIPYNQLSLADIFSDSQEIYESDKPQFLSLLQNHIDLDEIIPASFRKHFYASTDRSRKYPLNAFLWALIIQRLFSIPTDSLLLVFLHYSRHLREFCGFDKVPDASKVTRFKLDFLDDIQLVFHKLVDLTEPICQKIDSAKAHDFDDNYDPYKAASPDEDKSVHDARLLIPTLQDFFRAHPLTSPKTFLGDAAFDSVKLYKDLLSGDTFGTDSSGNGIHFSKAFIPLNSRAKLECEDYTLNEDGIPCCPHGPSLPMKPE